MLIELTSIYGRTDPFQNALSHRPHYYAYYCSKCDEIRSVPQQETCNYVSMATYHTVTAASYTQMTDTTY